MKKLGLLAMVLGIAGVVGISALSANAKDAPCHRTVFKTELIKNACSGDKGSQKAAKDAMKQFLKDNKSKKPGLDCTTCHAKLAPEYPLKPDALDTFKSLGGKLNADAGTAPTAPTTPAPTPKPTTPAPTPKATK
jgi:hypothetical protein